MANDVDWANIAESIMTGNTKPVNTNKVHKNRTHEKMPTIGDNLDHVEVSEDDAAELLEGYFPAAKKDAPRKNPEQQADMVVKNYADHAKKVNTKKNKKEELAKHPADRREVTSKDKRHVADIIKAKKAGKFAEARKWITKKTKSGKEYSEYADDTKEKAAERGQEVAGKVKDMKKRIARGKRLKPSNDPVHGLNTESLAKLIRAKRSQQKKTGSTSSGVTLRRNSKVRDSNKRAKKTVKAAKYDPKGLSNADIHKTARDIRTRRN